VIVFLDIVTGNMATRIIYEDHLDDISNYL
jgi:hypothetical protein